MSAPQFSVLFDAAPDGDVRRLLDELRAQTLTDWELVLDAAVGDREAGAGAAALDRRVRVVDAPVASAAEGVASAWEGARGRFVVLTDDSVSLRPTALSALAQGAGDDADLLYGDEEVETPGGGWQPLPRPDWSPERLRAHFYLGLPLAVRRSLVPEVGGWPGGPGDDARYDLVLRVSERARRVVHLRQVLARRRPVPAAAAPSGPSGVGHRAVAAHLARLGVAADVEPIEGVAAQRVVRRVAGTPRVSVIVPTRGASGTVGGRSRVFVVEAVRSVLERSTWSDLEVVVPVHESDRARVASLLSGFDDGRLVLAGYDEPFNYASVVNLGALVATGPYLVLLNDDVEVLTPDWIETLLGLTQDPEVGMVGCALVFEDGTWQHAGHLYRHGAPGHIGYGEDAGADGPLLGYRVARECSGVTAACAMLARSTYLEVGGLSTAFPLNYNDVDLSLKIWSSGRRVLWTPHARLHHFESRSRTPGIAGDELERIRGRWGRRLEEDPFWPWTGP